MFDHTALHHAFLAVQENHGCAGVDRVTVDQFAEGLTANLLALRGELAGHRYHPLPLLRIQVAKKNGEPRGMMLTPYPLSTHKRRVLAYPPPFDLDGYLRRRHLEG